MKHLKSVTKDVPAKAAIWNWPGELNARKQTWINNVSWPTPMAPSK